MIRSDLHIHSSFCDGADSPEDMVKEAINRGLVSLGFSGHMDPSVGVPMDIGKYKAEIRRLKEKYKGQIDIFLGGEVDCLFDGGDIDDLEYRIGSTHTLRMRDGRMFSVDDTEEILKKFSKEYYGGDYYALSRDYYETEAKIIEKAHPDFIGHFDLVLRFNDSLHFIDEDDQRYIKPALETMEYLAKADLPFEINCGAVNRGRRKDFYPGKRLLNALHGFGGRIVLSSDAHDKEHILASFREAAEAATDAGFKEAWVLKRDSGGQPVWESEALSC